MVVSRSVAPAYSLVAIVDPIGGEVPEIADVVQIVATDSCILIGCLCFVDGETDLTLGDANEVDPGTTPAFDGTLLTPSRKVLVQSMERETFLELPVTSTRTRIRIWTNEVREPDQVVIGVG